MSSSAAPEKRIVLKIVKNSTGDETPKQGTPLLILWERRQGNSGTKTTDQKKDLPTTLSLTGLLMATTIQDIEATVQG